MIFWHILFNQKFNGKKGETAYILDDADKCLSNSLLVLAFEFAILVWIPYSVVTVVQYSMMYTLLSLGPSSPISFLDALLIVRGASRVEREQKLWILVRFWRRKKCKTVGNFLFGFTLYYAHYISIRVTNDLVYYREGGRQCNFMSLWALLFDRLGPSISLLSLDCRKRGPYLGIWRQNEFRFFAGRTYTRYGNAFQKHSPFRCTLDCREQQSNRFADITNKNTQSDHFGQK